MNPLTDQQRQELEAKIREAVPESMELKEGCKVVGINIMDSHGDKRTVITKITDRNVYVKNNKINFREFRRKYKILGCPLNLQDVLITLRKAKKYFDVVPSSYKNCVCIRKIKKMVEAYGIYDLSKDYEHQSEELKSFLWSIICK